MTRLDRGLDELAVELGRTSEPPSAGPGPEGMPYVHATRLVGASVLAPRR